MSEQPTETNALPTVKEDTKRRRTSLKKDYSYNEQGQKLTKKGTIDRRSETSKKNIAKSSVYQAAQLAKDLKRQEQKKVAEEIPDTESESDEEDYEYEIEEIVKPKGQPQIVEIVKEVVVTDETRVKELEEKNRKLASKFRLFQGIENQTNKVRNTTINWRF